MSQGQPRSDRTPSSYERKVQNYLINRSFQLRWVGAVVVLTVLLVSVLGGYIVYAEQETSEAITSTLNSYYEADAAATMAEMMQAEDSAVLWVLLGTGLVLVLLLASMLALVVVLVLVLLLVELVLVVECEVVDVVDEDVFVLLVVEVCRIM